MSILWNDDTTYDTPETCIDEITTKAGYIKGTPAEHVMHATCIANSSLWIAGSTAHGLYNLVWGDGKNRKCFVPNDCDLLVDVGNDVFGCYSLKTEIGDLFRISGSIRHICAWNNFKKTSPLYADKSTRAIVVVMMSGTTINPYQRTYLKFDVFLHTCPSSYIKSVPLAHDGILIQAGEIFYKKNYNIDPEHVPTILMSGEYVMCSKNTLITTRKTNTFVRGYGKRLLAKGFTREQIDSWISSGHLDKIIWKED